MLGGSTPEHTNPIFLKMVLKLPGGLVPVPPPPCSSLVPSHADRRHGPDLLQPVVLARTAPAAVGRERNPAESREGAC